jgi:LysR family hydrogen peroxide-inducible transcriptional activator
MDLRHLRFAVELGRARNFTRAAERLGVAQPALSQAISSLEREFSVRLFERTSRRVQPTAVGMLFIEGAEEVLRCAERLRLVTQEHAVLLRGVLTIGTMAHFGGTTLPSMLVEFQTAYPGIELVLHSDNTGRTLQLVREGTIDLAFVNVGATSNHRDLAFLPVEWDEVAIALPPGHPLSSRSSLTLFDLHDEAFIGYRPGSNLHEILTAAAKAAGFTPKIVARSASSPLVRSLVSAGLGVTLGSKGFLLSPGPPVVTVPLVPRIGRDTVLVTRAGAEPNPPARAFVAFVKERLLQPEPSAAPTSGEPQ